MSLRTCNFIGILALLVCGAVLALVSSGQCDTAWQIIQVKEGDSIKEYQLVPEQSGDSVILERHRIQKIKLPPMPPKVGNYASRSFKLDSATIAAQKLNVQVTLDPATKKPGPVTVKVYVWWGERTTMSDSAQFRLGFQNLFENDPEVKTIRFGAERAWDTSFNVLIRPGDTCGVTVTILAPNNMGVDNLYLVGSRDSITTYHGDPRSIQPIRLVRPLIVKSARINGVPVEPPPSKNPTNHDDTIKASRLSSEGRVPATVFELSADSTSYLIQYILKPKLQLHSDRVASQTVTGSVVAVPNERIKNSLCIDPNFQGEGWIITTHMPGGVETAEPCIDSLHSKEFDTAGREVSGGRCLAGWLTTIDTVSMRYNDMDPADKLRLLNSASGIEDRLKYIECWYRIVRLTQDTGEFNCAIKILKYFALREDRVVAREAARRWLDSLEIRHWLYR